jgi:hypothetical protein
MSRGLIYWVIILIWIIIGLAPALGYSGPYVGHASNIVLLILFILLGWQVYGPPIRG